MSASPPSMSSLQLKVRNLSETYKKKVDVYFGKAGSDGIFDLLLAYLHRDKALWLSELANKSSQYKNFKDDLLKNPILFTRLKRKMTGINLLAVMNSKSMEVDRVISGGDLGMVNEGIFTHQKFIMYLTPHPISYVLLPPKPS
nr:hypothetical protein [Tanacetum cinerariifolium]